MTKKIYPSDKQEQFMVRFPDGLRDRIREAAEKNNRSMNAEIIATLEREYPPYTDVMHIHLDNIRKALGKYEKATDPKERLRLQMLVEAMVTSGNNFFIDWEDDEDEDNTPTKADKNP